MNLETALRFISQPIRANALPTSLTHMHQLLSGVGDPQQAFPSVVVAGSVGKGTTCYQLATLMGSRLKVGLYTSPHLHSFRERFSINGEYISLSDFTNAVSVIQQAVTQTGISYSTFEMSTALALWWFARQSVDIAVLEIGIGGRIDAVNTVANTLAIITPIELEHAAMLGGTLTSIAGHKAGVIQPNGYAFSAPQQPEVETVLRDEATAKQAELHFEVVDHLAIAACQNLIERRIIPPIALPAAPPPITLAGRMEQHMIDDKTWFIDGAHTLGSAQRLRDEINRLAPESPVRLIVGMLRDKAAHDFLAMFDDPRFHIVLVQLDIHRAANAAELFQAFKPVHAQVSLQPDLPTALEEAHTAPETWVVVTGSLRTAARSRELLGLLDAAALEEAYLTRHIFEGADYLDKLR